MNQNRGYTLIELIVAVGLFALIMVLASGAYFMMIGFNRQAQGIATGIDNLSFALESMTRTIRTGTAYSCGPSLGLGDCSPGSSFSFKDTNGTIVTYALATQQGTSGQVGDITKNGAVLTDPSVNVTSLTFYVSGTAAGNAYQPHVTMVVSGEVSYAAGKKESFTVETGATMRGPDI